MTGGSPTPETEHLSGLLADLVSEPSLERVFSKITGHARAALGASDIALLLEEDGEFICQSPSTVSRASARALERWVASDPNLSGRPLLLPDLSLVSGLPSVLDGDTGPAGSLCMAPLRYAQTSLGVLVALGGQGSSLDEVALATLEAFAVQAAVALTNARLFETQAALAKRDPLTGLFNHREFHETVVRELARSRDTGASLSVVLFDLDNFKLVNDTSGHGAGDRLLRSVASSLSASCRSGDAAFRVGGDEFGLILPRTSLEQADEVAQRAAMAVTAGSKRIGISYGVAGWPAHGPTKDGLLAEADHALYEMKGRRKSGAHEAKREDAASQRERLAVARRVSSLLAHARTVEEITQITVRELHHSFQYYLAVVQRLDPDRVLRVVAAEGPLSEEMTRFLALEQPIAEGVNGRVARTGEPAVVQDTRLDPDYLRRDPRADPGSELSLPIRVAGRIWGVLNLEQVETNALSDDDLLLADTVCALAGAALHRCALVAELETTFLSTLSVLSDAVETKDTYTGEHAAEVADLARAVGRRLALREQELRLLGYAALLHDVGKLSVRSELLSKPAALTKDEYEEIKEHSAAGGRMLQRIPFLAPVAPVVRAVHERWDGTGYPDGLAGPEIPLSARITAACDAYHAMTSHRPYRPAMQHSEALAELRAGSGTQFDPRVVDALVKTLEADLV